MHVHTYIYVEKERMKAKKREEKNPFIPFLKQVMACTEISHDLFVIWVFEL